MNPLDENFQDSHLRWLQYINMFKIVGDFLDCFSISVCRGVEFCFKTSKRSLQLCAERAETKLKVLSPLSVGYYVKHYVSKTSRLRVGIL